MSKDSDIAIVGRILREETRKRRMNRIDMWNAERRDEFAAFLTTHYDVPLRMHTEYHYEFTIAGHVYTYWPSNNRLRRKGWNHSKFLTPTALERFLLQTHPTKKGS